MKYKRIKGTKNYYINEYGEVRNRKTGNVLKPYKNNGYLYVKVLVDGKPKHIAIHRAVGELFVDGKTEERNIIDHIDGNRENNHKDNLRWVTQQENLLYGYVRRNDTPVRNYTNCILYYNGEEVKKFKSIAKAARYASKHFNCSCTMLRKHYKNKGCEIVKRCNDYPVRVRERDKHVSEVH